MILMYSKAVRNADKDLSVYRFYKIKCSLPLFFCQYKLKPLRRFSTCMSVKVIISTRCPASAKSDDYRSKCFCKRTDFLIIQIDRRNFCLHTGKHFHHILHLITCRKCFLTGNLFRCVRYPECTSGQFCHLNIVTLYARIHLANSF